MTDKRLFEVAFPLKQVSLDSVHERMCCMGTSPRCTFGQHEDRWLRAVRP